MTVSDIVFWVAAVVSVASGALVFRVMSMARATYALAASFIAVGVALIVLGLPYIGIITILMMVMEMTIMGVFMVMYMGHNPALMAMHMTQRKRTSAAVSIAIFLVLAAGILFTPWPATPGATGHASIAELGAGLMGSKILVMLIIGPVLFATIVTTVVLARPPDPDDPDPGGRQP